MQKCVIYLLLLNCYDLIFVDAFRDMWKHRTQLLESLNRPHAEAWTQLPKARRLALDPLAKRSDPRFPGTANIKEQLKISAPCLQPTGTDGWRPTEIALLSPSVYYLRCQP